jgi:hypothetical protein
MERPPGRYGYAVIITGAARPRRLQFFEQVQAGNNLVESQCLIGSAGRRMGGVACGADSGDLGTPRLQVLQCKFIEWAGDAPALESGRDGVEADFAGLAGPVQDGEDKTGDSAILLGDKTRVLASAPMPRKVSA